MTHSTVLKIEQTSLIKRMASPAEVLQDVIDKKVSGRLTIQDPSTDSVFWRVYLGQGRVHFVTNVMGLSERLSYMLQRYYPQLTPSKSLDIESDYQYLCQYWQSGQLSLSQIRKLLFVLSQDALVQFLALPQGAVQFEKILGIDPLVLSVTLEQLLTSQVQDFVRQWGKLRPEICSPFQRPFVIDNGEFEQLLKSRFKESSHLLLVKLALSQSLCLYEVADQLKITILTLATLLQPLVKAGSLGMHPYTLPQMDKRPMIACVDDSRTVQSNVEITLEAAGYRVLGLLEPVQALSELIKHKPSLILMDICMPEIDGYELCRMLRQSVLRDTPIVMVTGRDGLIDRVRARMVGVTEYIKKPFHPKQLLTIVRKKLLTTENGDEDSF